MSATSEPRTALVFPGQGSQRVGMGKAFCDAYPTAAAVFAEADEALGFALSELCWYGPDEELQLTANTQPAILTTSLAIQGVLEELGVRSVVMAGHSLGEYSALVAAGSLALVDAVRLVRRRGELMQEAVPVGEGAMAAVLGLTADEVLAIAEEATGDGVCSVANFNAPIQTVIAGHKDAVERAMQLATQRGARRSILLPVSAPFHCGLMEPAREKMEPLLDAAAIAAPRIPVISNVDAAPLSDGDSVRNALVRQISSAVRWVETLERMAAEFGVERFVEVGPGGVLSGLVRRTIDSASTISVAEPGDLEKLSPSKMREEA